VKARAEAISTRARTNIENWLRGMDRCTVLRGHARFESSDTLRVGDERISSERIFLNVGGRARVPAFPGVDRIPFLTNTSMVALDVLPRHLVVIGGSYVGLEFAQMYRRFGSEVTVIEMKPRLIAREDEDVSDGIKDALENEGVAFRLASECIAFEPAKDGVTVRVDCKVGDKTVTGSHVLLAVGRRPNTDDLGLEHTGVELDANGYVVVDDRLRTKVPGIWAMGDCNGRGAFTHTAYNDFEIVAANLLDDEPRSVTDRIEAYALYVDPPLGRAGITEAAARKTGKRILVGKRPMSRVGRAIEKAETQGFIKIVIEADTKRILGAAILGTEGDEAIHGILDTMYAGATSEQLRRTVAIHPTVSELIPTVIGEAK
jgi:pyruvate/2-oxoglutarate dehydrogenase complex dihydrolipoamide dehydrogenase (E3) component